MAEIGTYIDFAALAVEVDQVAPRPVSAHGGRSPFPTETMVRILVLKRLYNPTFPHCGQLRLFFEGAHLRMSGGSQTYSYPAVSGRPVNGRFDYSAARQRVSGQGPIPQGIYWIRPDELDDNWLNCRLSDRFANAWGRYRISIHPFTTTETYGRGGFFIHGGATPGSAGCIDLTNHMDQFVADLRREVGTSTQACQIHLEVLYPLPPGDYPTPGNTRIV